MDDRVTGRIAYSQDVERPGMLHGRILRSHEPHARVVGVSVVGELPEGCVVLLPEDVADTRLYGCLVPDTPILARGVVRFAGDPVAAVAAPTARAAARALTCLEADYETLPGATSLDAALAEGAPQLHPVEELRDAAGTWTGLRPGGGNVLHTFRLLHGRGEAGFDEAEVIVEGEWECAGAAHAPLEPHASLAEWSEGRLTVWTGTQTPFNVRRELASAFALDESDVRVISPPMGGSFGAKTFTRVEAIAAALARKAALPVRIVLPRDEVFVTLVRHPARFRVRLGAAARRDVRRAARVGRLGHRRVCRHGPERRREGRVGRRRPVPLRPRRGRFALRVHELPVGRRLPRLRGDAGRVGLGAVRRPAGRGARRRSARAAAAQRAARRRPLRDRRDDARLPRRGVPRARRRAHRLERGEARARASAP